MVEASSDVGFGALGLEVTGVEEVKGEVVVRVQTPVGQRVLCSGCGRGARSKGRREVVLRDAPDGGGRPRGVVWNKRIWACPCPGCATGSWTERSGLAGPRRVLTGRAVRWAVDRLAADLRTWASQQPQRRARAVEVVRIDPHEGYRSAIRSLRGGRLRADAKISVDRFHIVRLANQAVTKCRQRTQNQTLGHRGRRGDPLYGARKLLLMGAERLDDAGWDRLQQALDAGDPYDEAADCWTAKEKVRSVSKTKDPGQASDRLDDAISWREAPEAAPELHRLARTLDRWRTEIETSISTGTHNGRTEAANAKIKDVKRSARGFRNLANYRPRILLAAGQKQRETQPVTKIRTRRPSFDA